MGDLARSHNTALMFESLRLKIGEIFQQYIGGIVHEILPGKQYSERWAAKMKPLCGGKKDLLFRTGLQAIQELEEEETEAERYEKNVVIWKDGVKHTLEFVYLMDEEILATFQEINTRFAGREIKRIVIDRNWEHNSLGANLSYKFELEDGKVMNLTHWSDFNPDAMTFRGKPLHPEFIQHGSVILLKGENSQELTEEVVGTLYKAVQEAQQGTSEPLVLERGSR